ncbi:hypothetical protein FSHL1_000354 [Fusarium sambucinum]
MVTLTDLPNELLGEILLLATCGDQRQISRAAKWRRNSKFEVGSLALHLLRHPYHRPLVRTLDFFTLSTLNLLERNPNDASRANLRPETLAELAEAAERTIPDFANSSNWAYCIRKGCTDAIAMLILAWATQVTEVEFDLPGYAENDSVHNSNRMMQFIDWAAHNISTRGNRDLPLAKVQHLKVGISHSRHDTELPMSVFHLPRLRRLTASGLRINSRDVSIPEHGFAIETLRLEDSKIIGNGLWDIIGACKELLVLCVFLNERAPMVASKRAISNAILRQAGSLKELHLDFETWHVNWLDEPQVVSSHEEIPLHRCFQYLEKLEGLTVDVEDLRSSPEEQIMPDFFGPRLPLSLRTLSIHWKTEEGFPAEFFFLQGEFDVYLDVVNALKALLAEVGAGYRTHLRYFYHWGILEASDELDEVEEFMKKNGVVVKEYPFEDSDYDIPFNWYDWYTNRD